MLLVKQYQNLLSFDNVKLEFTGRGFALSDCQIKLLERDTGARGLRSILENILLDTMFNLPGVEGVDEAVVNADAVRKSLKTTFYLRSSLVQSINNKRPTYD